MSQSIDTGVQNLDTADERTEAQKEAQRRLAVSRALPGEEVKYANCPHCNAELVIYIKKDADASEEIPSTSSQPSPSRL